MNTPADHHDDLRCAEYALGVLDAAARREVEQQMQSDPRIAAQVEQWQQRLAPLAEEIGGVAPADYVWAHIVAALNLSATNVARDTRTARPRERTGLWNNLRLWHWIGVSASAVAAACLIALFVLPRQPSTPTAIQQGYMVASIQQNSGVAGWTATMDLQHGRMIVVPASPAALPSGKAPELWLIPPGKKPIALGVIGSNKSTTVTLTPALLAQLSAKALLAVSVEPPGGSPTGQPTGPVIAKGAISGA